MTIRHHATALAAAALALSAGTPLAQQLPPDTLRVASPVICPTQAVPASGSASPCVYTHWPMYETLVMIDLKGEATPLLATEWRNVAPTKWQFKLRPGVKFHNGADLTAQGVVDWFTYLATQEALKFVSAQNFQRQAKIVKTTAIDAMTIEVETSAPNSLVSRLAANYWVPEAKLFKDIGIDAMAQQAAGTGPHKLVSWDATAVNYTAHEQAWRPSRIKNVRVLHIPEAAGRVAGVLSGELDISIGLPIDDMDRIRTAGHQVHVISRPDVNAIRIVSTRETPFKDKRVRQAVNHAVDRTAITRDLMKGLAEPGSQCGNKLNFGFNPDVKPYAYDPAKARQLLAQAGHPNGFEVGMDVIPDNFPADSASYQAIAQYLTAIGLKVSLNRITFADWLRKWTPPAGSTSPGFPDLFQNGCHNASAHPMDFMINMSCRRPATHHCDQDELKLIDAIEREFDVDKQRKLVQDLLKLNQENASAIFIADIPDITALHRRVQGFDNVMQRYSFAAMTMRQ